jgi:hypothetical protein
MLECVTARERTSLSSKRPAKPNDSSITRPSLGGRKSPEP